MSKFEKSEDPRKEKNNIKWIGHLKHLLVLILLVEKKRKIRKGPIKHYRKNTVSFKGFQLLSHPIALGSLKTNEVIG